MNFNNYTRIQLGIPPASADAGMAAVRRARMMQMNGFGAFAGPAISQVTGQPCSAGDYDSQEKWHQYCNCLFIKGSGPMQVCCGKQNMNADGSCGAGAGAWWAGNPNGWTAAPWTVIGKGERFFKSSDLGKAIQAEFEKIVSGQTGGPAPIEVDDGNGTDTGSGGIEEKKDNTMLIVGLGVAAVAVLALSMRK